MHLRSAIIWLIATVLAGYNAFANVETGMWILITLLFAANAARQYALHVKEKKE